MNNSRFNPNFSIKYPNINVKYDDEVANTFFSYVISGDVNKLNQYVTNNSIPIQNDLTILLNDNLVALLTTNQKKDILPLFDRLYRKSTNLRYIVLIDKNGQEYSVPYSYKEIISRRQKNIVKCTLFL